VRDGGLGQPCGKPLCAAWRPGRVPARHPSLPSSCEARGQTPGAAALGHALGSFRRQKRSCRAALPPAPGPVPVSAGASYTAGAPAARMDFSDHTSGLLPIPQPKEIILLSAKGETKSLMKAVRFDCGNTLLYKEFSVFFSQRPELLLHARRYFRAESPPCQARGKDAAQAVGSHRTLQPQFSLMFQHLKGQGGKKGKKRKKKNHCNSGGKQCFNSCPASYPSQAFCVCYLVAEGSRDSSRCHGPPRPRKQP